jgi:CheY-like chemotaxis protein
MTPAQDVPRVLLIEADEQILDFLMRRLRNMGADPHPTRSAQQAADLIGQQKFDGVFLSLAMPGVKALELVEKVRWSPSNSRCPIVLLYEARDSEQLKPCFRAGANFLLAKPVTEDQLHTLLNATRGLMLHERRRYRRVPCKFPVLCEWTIQSLSQRATGNSINVSSSGMLLKLGLSPPPHAVVEARFSLPSDTHHFTITARVTRTSSDQKVGLTFSQLTEPQRRRLLDFCAAMVHEEAGDSTL